MLCAFYKSLELSAGTEHGLTPISTSLTSNTKVTCMRPATLTLLLLSACAAPTAAPPAPAPIQAVSSAATVNTGGEAWQTTHWGMSKAEVHEALPQAVDWVQRYGAGGPSKEFQRFGIQKYPIEGACYVELDFIFKDGGLSSVNLSVRNDSMVIDDDIRCAGIVERGLTGKYGRAVTSDTRHEKSVTTKSISWVTPSSQIDLGQIRMPIYNNPDGSVAYSYFTTIYYQPRKADVERKF